MPRKDWKKCRVVFKKLEKLSWDFVSRLSFPPFLAGNSFYFSSESPQNPKFGIFMYSLVQLKEELQGKRDMTGMWQLSSLVRKNANSNNIPIYTKTNTKTKERGEHVNNLRVKSVNLKHILEAPMSGMVINHILFLFFFFFFIENINHVLSCRFLRVFISRGITWSKFIKSLLIVKC